VSIPIPVAEKGVHVDDCGPEDQAALELQKVFDSAVHDEVVVGISLDAVFEWMLEDGKVPEGAVTRLRRESIR
jgi:hypothetical protein